MKRSLYFILLLLIGGCGKKMPIGYDIVRPREGEIRIAKAEFVPPYPVYSEFASTKGNPYLWIGKEKNFEAQAFVCFEFDSLVTPESLWIVRRDSGEIQVCKVMNLLNMDSVNWSNKPLLQPFGSLKLTKDTNVISIEALGTDSVFYIGFNSIKEEMIRISSRPWITIKKDTLHNSYYPKTSLYIDTSYFSQNLLPDTLTFIETGAFVTRCTLYLKFFILDSLSKDSRDTFWTSIELLTDSLRKLYSLDSVTVNEAKFKIWIDQNSSYKKDIDIKAHYEVEGKKISTTSSVKGDSIFFSFESIINTWFKNGEKLWLVFEGKTKEISRVVLTPTITKFSIVYTVPPKRR